MNIYGQSHHILIVLAIQKRFNFIFVFFNNPDTRIEIDLTILTCNVVYYTGPKFRFYFIGLTISNDKIIILMAFQSLIPLNGFSAFCG
jgi:hypothetical protein